MSWGVYDTNDNDELHVCPIEDLRDHYLDRKCWCKPERVDEDPRLWSHKSMDRREEFEQGRQMS